MIGEPISVSRLCRLQLSSPYLPRSLDLGDAFQIGTLAAYSKGTAFRGIFKIFLDRTFLSVYISSVKRAPPAFAAGQCPGGLGSVSSSAAGLSSKKVIRGRVQGVV